MRNAPAKKLTIPAFLCLLMLGLPAGAATIQYGFRLVVAMDVPTTAPFPLFGQFVVDDSLFAPGALVPLTDFSLTYDIIVETEWGLSDCSIAQGRVDGAGAEIDALDVRCTRPLTELDVSILDLDLDQEFALEIVAGVVVVPGTYSVFVPEPAAGRLLLAGILAPVLVARSRPSGKTLRVSRKSA